MVHKRSSLQESPQVDTILRAIMEGTAKGHGEHVFRTLVQFLAVSLSGKAAFIAKIGHDFTEARTLALRDWLNLSRQDFYNESLVAIVPSGFCFPGSGKNGDLPPRHECAPLWHERLLKLMPDIKLTLLIGSYAHALYLNADGKATLTETVAAWREYLPDYFPLPHPSPRNRPWLTKNTWFEKCLLPELRERMAILNA